MSCLGATVNTTSETKGSGLQKNMSSSGEKSFWPDTRACQDDNKGLSNASKGSRADQPTAISVAAFSHVSLTKERIIENQGNTKQP